MYKKQMLLGGLLRIKGMRQMIKSKPYQAEKILGESLNFLLK